MNYTRSCRLRDDSCAFFIGQAQVAFLQHTEEAPDHVAAWLLDKVPLRSLQARGVQLERHAEVIESDPARWHWLHVRDRIADPNDVLFPLAPLISTLADNPAVSQFFTYSSLNRLCFSASSHYPWVGDFPVVVFIEEQGYFVDEVPCNFETALAKIESALATSPVKPFFGSEPYHDFHIIERLLVQQGSFLRPQLVRRGQWTDLVMAHGSRKCITVESETFDFVI